MRENKATLLTALTVAPQPAAASLPDAPECASAAPRRNDTLPDTIPAFGRDEWLAERGLGFVRWEYPPGYFEGTATTLPRIVVERS